MKIIYSLFMLCVAQQLHATPSQDTTDYPYNNLPAVFPGTKELTWTGDLSSKMLDGAHRFIDRKLKESVAARKKMWNRDLSSRDAYIRSIEANRKRFRQYIGIVDSVRSYNVGIPERQPSVTMQKISDAMDSEIVAETSKYRVYYVRWPASNRVYGEGLLLQPKTTAAGHIIALPDADQLPEQIAGLQPGVSPSSQFARRLAENGFEVLVPLMISRTYLFPGEHKQQTYREWLYRQSFHMGRHLIGFEVQKVISAVSWFKSKNKNAKVGVAGFGEGALIAFYSAAADQSIDAVMVSGYFNDRQNTWDEPLYRNVWGLLSEFGDAEIASLIAPRAIVIEYSNMPEVNDRLPEGKGDTVGDFPYTGYKGKLQTPSFASVQQEFNRIDELVKRGFQSRKIISGSNGRPVAFGSEQAVQAFAEYLGVNARMVVTNEMPEDKRKSVDNEERQKRQVYEIEDHVQFLVRDSDQERNWKFLYKAMPQFSQRVWSTKSYHPYHSPDQVIGKAKSYRKYFNEEIIGRFEDSLLPPGALTRKIYDNERWAGFEVVLNVFDDLFATGILLIPKDIRKGEKRPVVVCQHGRNDVPHSVVAGNFTSYNNAAAKLADQGFVVYVPQNPYRGEDRYRLLSRKANLLRKTLFSFIVSQHEQTLRWLGALPFVDHKRIAFYGLSYGGETAMRVPAILEGYCLSICAGDFGDWTRKVTDTRFVGSFMNSLEWEMPYFNMGGTFSYAEMAYLIFPRPFMVERGHHDLVQPTEWVLYEYGKVKFFYDQFNHGDKVDIDIFNGGHSMRGEGTFEFLHKHLQWP